jgi:hypothetical protein
MGKPRAKLAIEDLIQAGLVSRTDASSKMMPQYRLVAAASEAEPIFLPVQFITGFSEEVSLIRRVRETGDPLLLRMLIDLYGFVQIDAPHGLPLEVLHLREPEEEASRKVFERGVHTLWALAPPESFRAAGDWCRHHHVKGSNDYASWEPFWRRLRLLQKIGAIWFENWLFDGAELDAEPLFPVTEFRSDSDGASLRTLSRRFLTSWGKKEPISGSAPEIASWCPGRAPPAPVVAWGCSVAGGSRYAGKAHIVRAQMRADRESHHEL